MVGAVVNVYPRLCARHSAMSFTSIIKSLKQPYEPKAIVVDPQMQEKVFSPK